MTKTKAASWGGLALLVGAIVLEAMGRDGTVLLVAGLGLLGAAGAAVTAKGGKGKA